MGVPKTSDHIQIKIKTANPSQDFRDMDVLCIFKNKIESQNQNMGVAKTNDHTRISKPQK